MDVDLSEFLPVKAKPCLVARLLTLLEEEDVTTFEAALAADHITVNALTKWLKKRELTVGDSAVRRHRLRECCCHE